MSHVMTHTYVSPFSDAKSSEYGPKYRDPGQGEPGMGGFIMPWDVPQPIQTALKSGLKPGW